MVQGHVLQVWSWCGRARSCSYGTVQCVLGQGHVLTAWLKVWLGKVMFLRDSSRCDGARSCSNGTVQGARSCSYGTVQGVVGQGHVLTEPFKVWWHKVMFLKSCSLDSEATVAAPGRHSNRQFLKQHQSDMIMSYTVQISSGSCASRHCRD